MIESFDDDSAGFEHDIVHKFAERLYREGLECLRNRQGNSTTFENEPCHCRVARQTLSNLIAVWNLIRVAELSNDFKRRATSVSNKLK